MSATDLNAALAPTIALNEIPDDWRVPGVSMEVRPQYTNQGLNTLPSKVLIVGAGGAVYQPAYGKPYQITRKGQASVLFAAGSDLAAAVEAFIAANPNTPVWAMQATPNPGGLVFAYGSFGISAAPQAAGSVAIKIGGTRIAVSVAASDLQSVIAQNLADAINAINDIPVIATIANGAPTIVTVTSKFAGLMGNAIDLRLSTDLGDVLPKGLTCSITPMGSGSGTFNIDLDAISNQWFTDIVLTMTDAGNIVSLVADLNARYKAQGRKDCHGWLAYGGTYSQLIAWTPGLLNCPFLSVIGACRMPSPPWSFAATLAAVSVAALANDPSRQLRSLVLPGLTPPDDNDCFVDEEKDQLLRNGVSTFSVVAGQVVLDRVITTYIETSLGAPDTAWLDIMVPKTMTAIRYDWRQYALKQWPRAKLAPDGSTAEVMDTSGAVVTPRRAHNSWASRCKIYAAAGWIVNETATIAASIFEIDPNDKNRMKTQLQLELIGNLMRLDGALEFAA